MLHLALAALLQVAPPAPRDSAPSAPVLGASIGAERRLPLDSIAPRRPGDYATPALQALVGEASVRNRRVPPALEGYTARVESEMALVLKRAEGQEVTASLEQTSNLVRWKRTGEYEQRVVGYRATQLSIAPSIVGVSESAWTVPTLYGNRILLLSGIDSARRSKRDSVRRARATKDPRGAAKAAAKAARNRVYLAEHPLGEERDRFYRFTGGDTVARIVVHGHTVDVVRVTVEPRGGYARRVVVFRGEMDLDARRRQLVRLRGYFDEVGPPLPNTPGRLLSRTVQAVAYVELVNQEVNGAWWLPTYQRIEPQVAMPALGDGRSVMRIVSRWRDLQVQQGPEAQAWVAALARGDTTVPDPAMDSAATHDTLRAQKHRLSFAPRDSIDGFAAWTAELGAESGKVRAEDFDDIAPDRWRPTGRPRFEWRVSRPSDVARFNRVEGLFTGYGAELRLRDAAPGVTVRGTAGWTWHEQAARGRLVIDRTRHRTSAGVRGGRWVDLTNDFRSALDSGSSLAAVLGTDAYDYVDRTGAAAYVTRRLTRDEARPLVARLEAGVMHDGAMRRVVREAPIAMGTSDSGFLENRGVREGRYARVVAQLELDPDMAGEGLRPGIGALLHAEVTAGELEYARTEARVLARRSWTFASGTTTLALRGDAGAVFGIGAVEDGASRPGADGAPPPQQLFELGGLGAALTGYEYKEFAGDRAMLGRVLALHTFPLLRRPMRVTRSFALPGLAPGVSVGWQSGWTSVGERLSARSALAELAPPGSAPGTMLSRPTNGVKSSIDLRLRFFGGNASLGAARPVERGGRWRFVAGLVQEL
jgi:hypothetical protein